MGQPAGPGPQVFPENALARARARADNAKIGCLGRLGSPRSRSPGAVGVAAARRTLAARRGNCGKRPGPLDDSRQV